MSTIDFRNAWQEALRRALLACQPESELSDPALAAAAGLPVRSGLQAGYKTGVAYYAQVGGGQGESAGCMIVTIPRQRYPVFAVSQGCV
jgi:hypothetical protein